ncbi:MULTISPECIES: hypothetical protein [unclassified Microcoleus]|uniref:hypothetical protein n=1 Tax=unclassified Microcoleus TaxID=2642155 RepID=UPI0025DD4071|nr:MULTISPECIES: hypothetical protein [unclassified Microcoleus]
MKLVQEALRCSYLKFWGKQVVLTYLIVFASSLEAIALALSPGNFRIKLPLGEAQQSDIKSGIFTSQSPPNAAPDTASTGLADGIYLYGQSSQPDRIKKEYFVFEMRQSKVVGAFYLPRSAFYCFYGTAERTQLNLTVVDTYDGSRSPYSVNLQQYHPISAVSDNDRRILGICKEAHKQQVWGN